ncbi:TPA: hypothetical protein ACX87D_001701 [Legionella pneumophila]
MSITTTAFEEIKCQSSERKFKRFLLAYLFIISIPIVLLALSYMFLFNAFELRDFTTIVRKQNESNAIYGTGIDIYYYDYKKEFVKLRKPVVLALGSSRALGLHEEVFNVPFTNAGQGMVSLEQGFIFIKEMLKFHKPKVIIISLDFWWFNDKVGGKGYGFTQFDPVAVTWTRLLKPYILLAKNNITWRDFFNVLLLRKRTNNITKFNNLGIFAIKTSSGTKPDGSTHWGYSVLTGKDTYDYQFKLGLNFIKNGTSNYEYASEFSKTRMEELNKIVKLCQANGIELYLFVPPVAEAIYKNMMSMKDKYLYIDKLRHEFKSFPVHISDFHNPQDIPSNDCEFGDHYHAGDVTYLKMLLKMANEPANQGLRKYLRINLIRQLINKYEGNVLVPFDENLYFTGEKDMHNLGCIKKWYKHL